MKFFAIITSFDPKNKPNSEFESYYIFLSNYLNTQNIQMVRISLWTYNIWTKKFDDYRKLEKKGYERIKENIKPDRIYYRGRGITYNFLDIRQNYKSLNNRFLSAVTGDKLLVENIFGNIQPKTIDLLQYKNNVDFYKKIFGDKYIIMKPRFGSGGKGVQKLETSQISNFIKNIPEDSLENYLLQEFIDTSKGIKGVVDGIHDIRAMIFGNQIGYFVVRYAEGDSFLCNIHQGGGSYCIETDKMPKVYNEKIKIIINKVNSLCYNDNMVYTIDFFVNQIGEFRLIEMNSQAGFNPIKDDVVFSALHSKLLLEVIQKL